MRSLWNPQGCIVFGGNLWSVRGRDLSYVTPELSGAKNHLLIYVHKITYDQYNKKQQDYQGNFPCQVIYKFLPAVTAGNLFLRRHLTATGTNFSNYSRISTTGSTYCLQVIKTAEWTFSTKFCNCIILDVKGLEP